MSSSQFKRLRTRHLRALNLLTGAASRHPRLMRAQLPSPSRNHTPPFLKTRRWGSYPPHCVEGSLMNNFPFQDSLSNPSGQDHLLSLTLRETREGSSRAIRLVRIPDTHSRSPTSLRSALPFSPATKISSGHLRTVRSKVPMATPCSTHSPLRMLESLAFSLTQTETRPLLVLR